MLNRKPVSGRSPQPERCKPRVKTHQHTPRPTLKRWSLLKLTDTIREDLPKIRAVRRSFSAEELGKHYQASKDLVVQALHRLNLEGLISRRHNQPPFESHRGRSISSSHNFWSEWCSSVYYLGSGKRDPWITLTHGEKYPVKRGTFCAKT